MNAGSERKYLRSAAEQMRTGKKETLTLSQSEGVKRNQFMLAQRNSQTAKRRRTTAGDKDTSHLQYHYS